MDGFEEGVTSSIVFSCPCPYTAPLLYLISSFEPSACAVRLPGLGLEALGKSRSLYMHVLK